MEDRKVVGIDEAKSSKVIQAGVFQIDLAKLTPLTLGDKEELAKPPYNVDFNKIEKTPAEDINLVWFVLRKVEPQVTREAAAALPIRTSGVIVQYFTRISMEVDVPLGLLPTPSRGTTAGPSKA